MNRRNFLKLVGVVMAAPSVLGPEKKKDLTVGFSTQDIREWLKNNELPNYDNSNYFVVSKTPMPIGHALEDIPKDGYGWVQIRPIPLREFYIT